MPSIMLVLVTEFCLTMSKYPDYEHYFLATLLSLLGLAYWGAIGYYLTALAKEVCPPNK